MIGNEKDDNLHNENKNQGLVNTIVNHNKKIKSTKNKFNLIVNNFVNFSHVKEIEKQTKEIERHVFGPPRPHSSRREFVLIAVIVVIIGMVLIIGGKKLIGSGLIN